MLIDSHCHLNHEQLRADSSEAVRRAVEAGVTHMVVVGYDLPSSDEAVELSDRFEAVYAAVGVHPHDARHYSSEAERRLRELASHPRVVAIGEIGLDYHYDLSPVEAQAAAFQAQLELASEVGLPVIIHCREAYGDTLSVLRDGLDRTLGGVMHCWAGTQAEADWALELGMYLGFGGVLTFKNAVETRSIAARVPLSRILLETDAPYLAPVPHRGKRNEPAYTRLVGEKLAEVRGIDLTAVAAATAASARALFARMAEPASG